MSTDFMWLLRTSLLWVKATTACWSLDRFYWSTSTHQTPAGCFFSSVNLCSRRRAGGRWRSPWALGTHNGHFSLYSHISEIIKTTNEAHFLWSVWLLTCSHMPLLYNIMTNQLQPAAWLSSRSAPPTTRPLSPGCCVWKEGCGFARLKPNFPFAVSPSSRWTTSVKMNS